MCVAPARSTDAATAAATTALAECTTGLVFPVGIRFCSRPEPVRDEGGGGSEDWKERVAAAVAATPRIATIISFKCTEVRVVLIMRLRL